MRRGRPCVVTYDFDDTLVRVGGQPIYSMLDQLRRDAARGVVYIVTARSRFTDALAPSTVADTIAEHRLPVQKVYLTGSVPDKIRRVLQLRATRHYDDLPEVNHALQRCGVDARLPLSEPRRNAGGTLDVEEVDQAALAAAQQHAPHLTALAVARRMPGIDGWVVEVVGRRRTPDGGRVVQHMLLEIRVRDRSDASS